MKFKPGDKLLAVYTLVSQSGNNITTKNKIYTCKKVEKSLHATSGFLIYVKEIDNILDSSFYICAKKEMHDIKYSNVLKDLLND